MAFASRRKRPGQGRGREAAATVGGGDEDDEDEELEISNEANESSNAQRGWRKRFAEEGSERHKGRNDALATSEFQQDTPRSQDARALREAALKRAASGQDRADDGVYKGMNGYVDWTAGFRREQTLSCDAKASVGPQRAPSNVRRSYEIDYNPPICKDFKETGFCGYGDSCKFAHMREDYKSGWQLENDWEERQKAKQREQMKAAQRAAKVASGEAVDDEDVADKNDDDESKVKGPMFNGLPFACYICRKSFMEVRDPVVTRCKHYFCEECALRRFQTDRTCAACGAHTQGVFNAATDIINEGKKRKREESGHRTSDGSKVSCTVPESSGTRSVQQGWTLG